MKPFIVTDETKAMVMNNIAYMLNSFLKCSEFKNYYNMDTIKIDVGEQAPYENAMKIKQYILEEFA